MSRHRMVRNLTQDDYYDDYDDYYDEEDDYEGYDNSYVAPNKPKSNQTAGAGIKAASTSSSNTSNKIQSTKAVSAKLAIAKPKPNKNVPPKATTTTTTSVGVVKPPSGWGKPSSTTSVLVATEIAATAVTAAAETTTATTTTTAGVTKPPPGWGKPSSRPLSADKPSADTTTEMTSAAKRPGETTTTESSQNPYSQKQQQQPYKGKPRPPFLQQRNAIPSQLSMVCIGHVDAGKSTIIGQLLVQTGQVSKRQAQKQDNNLAWLLDENTSERERGVTMEIGTKALSTKNHQIVMLDAPGHADFIPIMITGAAHADTALLVVDAVKGEFEAGFSGGGQTKEHILLAKGLGVSQVIVAINKLDVEGWDKQDRYEYVQKQVVEFLVQQRFKPARIQCVPVSGLTGENVQSQSEPLLREWYKGPTLLQAMDRFKPANRQLDKPLRFLVSDMYAEGKGVVTRGRVVQGFLQVGDKVTVLPLGDSAVISKLEHLQAPVENQEGRLAVAVAGDTVEIVLANVDPMRIAVGNVVVDPTHLPPIAKGAKARVLIMDDLAVPVIRGAQVLFHMHSLDAPASLTKLIALLNPSDGSILKERPRALTSGASAIVELKLSDNTKIVMDRFQECRALGRFVLRRGGDTIAVGIIEEIIVE